MQGITLATYSKWLGRPASKDELHNIPDQHRDAIYESEFWRPIRGDELPLPLAMVTMDAAVNSGPYRAAQWLQQALGVEADGSIGPHTIVAACAADAAGAVRAACGARLTFLQADRDWPIFGHGWSNRVEDTQEAALAAIVPP